MVWVFYRKHDSKSTKNQYFSTDINSHNIPVFKGSNPDGSTYYHLQEKTIFFNIKLVFKSLPLHIQISIDTHPFLVILLCLFLDDTNANSRLHEKTPTLSEGMLLNAEVNAL